MFAGEVYYLFTSFRTNAKICRRQAENKKQTDHSCLFCGSTVCGEEIKVLWDWHFQNWLSKEEVRSKLSRQWLKWKKKNFFVSQNKLDRFLSTSIFQPTYRVELRMLHEDIAKASLKKKLCLWHVLQPFLHLSQNKLGCFSANVGETEQNLFFQILKSLNFQKILMYVWLNKETMKF